MKFRAFCLRFSIIVLTAGLAACDDAQPGPTQPSNPSVQQPPPAPVAPTLTAPTADGPAENEQLQTLRPTLRVLNATSNQSGAKTYEFQISDDSNFSQAADVSGPFRVVLTRTGVAEGSDGKTLLEVGEDLQPTTRFYWRARVRQGTTDGPWSSTATFRTRIQGYNRAGELYDPLTNGTTVGRVIGSVTFTPGRGATINNNESHIRYDLVQTITNGEFSVEVEGLQNNSPGDKTKIMSMYDGRGEIHDHPWRMTVEKRDGGIIAWRMIAGAQEHDQIDTIGNERVSVNFNPGTTYFWRARWGGGFNLEIFQGGEFGSRIYEFGKGLGAVYRPSPHIAHLGSPIPRSGPADASVPGATYRNAFIGSRGGRPRPLSLGSALRV